MTRMTRRHDEQHQINTTKNKLESSGTHTGKTSRKGYQSQKFTFPGTDVTINSYHADIFRNLHKMQKEGILCDTKLLAKTGYVMAHRLVLVACSSYFCEGLDEKKYTDAGGCLSLDLTHIPLYLLKRIISFIYGGQIQVPKKDVPQFEKCCQSVGLKSLFEQLNCDLNIKDNLANEVKGKSSRNSRDTSKSSNLKQTLVDSRIEGSEENSPSFDASGRDISFQISKSKPFTDGSSTEKNDKNIEIQFSNKKGASVEESVPVEVCPEVKQFINRFSTTNPIRKNCSSSKGTSELKTINSKNDRSKIVDKDHLSEEVKKVTSVEHNKLSSCDTTNERNDESSIDVTDSSSSDHGETEKLSLDHDAGMKCDKKAGKRAITAEARTCKVKQLCCKKCNETFSAQFQKTAHKQVCKGNRPRRRCILCRISFSTAEDYIHHRNTDTKCLQIRNEKHKKRLQRKAQLRSKFACRVCPRKFRRIADLVDHEFTAHDLPYDKEKWPDLICEWCGYKTINPWRLHHHKTYDCSKGMEHVCDICGNNYKNEKTLKFHKEMMHVDVVPMLPCDQCGKTLKGPKGLENHIRIMHKGENPHKRHMCHMCSMKYTSANDLTFHLHRVHKQPLPDGFVVFTCPECNYVINHKRLFDKHMLLHEDKRDFNCDKCDKSFKTKGSLQIHMKSHIGKKIPCPYEDCKYGALKKCHLNTHIENQHTRKGMKNEKCHLCSYSTFFKGNLLKHLRTVHQLEVVTRYSVQMKAKYKNMKTGDIVGVAATEDIENGNRRKIDNNNSSKNKDDIPDGCHKKQMLLAKDKVPSSLSQFPKPPHVLSSHELPVRMEQTEQNFISTSLTSVIAKNPYQIPGYSNYAGPSLSAVDIYNVNPSHDPSMLTGHVVHAPSNNGTVYTRDMHEYDNISIRNKSATGTLYPNVFQQHSVDPDVTGETKTLTYIQI